MIEARLELRLRRALGNSAGLVLPGAIAEPHIWQDRARMECKLE